MDKDKILKYLNDYMFASEKLRKHVKNETLLYAIDYKREAIQTIIDVIKDGRFDKEPCKYCNVETSKDYYTNALHTWFEHTNCCKCGKDISVLK